MQIMGFDQSVRISFLLCMNFATFLPLFLLSTTSTASMNNMPRRLVVKLIHPNSVLSPLRNPRLFLSDINPFLLSAHTFNDSQETHKRKDHFLIPKSIQVDYVYQRSSRFAFLMNFSIGQPPVPQLVILDTGSNLLWIHCFPCKTCPQSAPVFVPSQSSTFASFSCKSHACYRAPHHGCDMFNEVCTYKLTYLGGNFATLGGFSTEQLVFGTLDEGVVVVPKVSFGCSHELQGSRGVIAGINGVFGLGPRFPSLVTRMNKFSYCIGNLRDPNYGFNKLILGDDAIFEGDSTPLYLENNHYGIVLEGISIGQERLEIDPSTFAGVGYEDGAVIDSGTRVTYLALDGYKALRNKLESFLDEFLTRTHYREKDELCYNGSIDEDLKGFPVVGFHFAEGADLVLDVESLFHQLETSHEFCLAIFPSTQYKNLSIIGLLAQQYYNVGYDVGGQRLYFQRIDCELLED